MGMKSGKVRPLAICVFRNGDRILAAEGYDSVKQQTFYRPLGGKIEFGERGAETIVREVMEEIGETVTGVRYLGMLENLFTYQGEPGHEIVLVYDGKFADDRVYRHDVIDGAEDDKSLFKAYWKSLTYFRDGNAPLYPDGLLELLEHDRSQ